jgi:hypothetical protein
MQDPIVPDLVRSRGCVSILIGEDALRRAFHSEKFFDFAAELLVPPTPRVQEPRSFLSRNLTGGEIQIFETIEFLRAHVVSSGSVA